MTATSTGSGSVLVLCDGQTYDGYTTKPFTLDSAVEQDPNIQKVIRNCVFRNSDLPAIVIKSAANVLIEGNTFENIRTNVAGVGVHAISIPCRSAAGCNSGNPIDNITIRDNTFRYIGADGIQLGDDQRYISHVYIQNNEFVGRDDVGENAVDVKGVEGPIFITGNTVRGFRPCESPNTIPSGTQDCSGANGSGIVIHDGGGTNTSATNVTLEDNEMNDNIDGLAVTSGAKDITVRNNRSHNNLSTGMRVNKAFSVVITGNTFSDNPIHIDIDNTPLAGGFCTVTNNTFSGIGIELDLYKSFCSQ